MEHLKGKISDDGKSFTTDKDNETYTIENSAKVKGHEGHDVVLGGHVDATNNSIHVTSVKMASEKKPMSEQPLLPPSSYNPLAVPLNHQVPDLSRLQPGPSTVE